MAQVWALLAKVRSGYLIWGAGLTTRSQPARLRLSGAGAGAGLGATAISACAPWMASRFWQAWSPMPFCSLRSAETTSPRSQLIYLIYLIYRISDIG
jgi:hypothetical protein